MFYTMAALLNPIALKLGPLEVRWYGIIITSAIALAVYLTVREAGRLGHDGEYVYTLAMWAVPVAIVGARLYEVFVLQWDRLDYYLANPGQIMATWEGGLAIHGAIIGGILTGWLVVRAHKQDFWLWADMIAPQFILAQAIGRWGNFFNQEAFGSAAPQWLIDLMPGWFREQMTIGGTVMHPTFLYESVWNLLTFGILLAWRRRNPRRGTLIFAYIGLYGLGRFIIESIREDSSYWFGWLRIAQAVSLGMVVLALIGIWWRYRATRVRYADPAVASGSTPVTPG